MDYTTEYDEQKKSQIWDSKYGRESQGTHTREWLCWLRPEAIVNNRPVLSSERAPHINKPATVWRIPYGNKNLVVSPGGCFIPRQTGRLIVGRNIRLRLRWEAGTWGWGAFAVGSRYQATASENWENFMCAVVTVIFLECVTQWDCCSYL
jgi:hypothetical protein